MPSASQNTDVITFPADGTDLVFFGANNWLMSTIAIYGRGREHFSPPTYVF